MYSALNEDHPPAPNAAPLDLTATLMERSSDRHLLGHLSCRGQNLADGPSEEFGAAKPDVGADLE